MLLMRLIVLILWTVQQLLTVLILWILLILRTVRGSNIWAGGLKTYHRLKFYFVLGVKYTLASFYIIVIVVPQSKIEYVYFSIHKDSFWRVSDQQHICTVKGANGLSRLYQPTCVKGLYEGWICVCLVWSWVSVYQETSPKVYRNGPLWLGYCSYYAIVLSEAFTESARDENDSIPALSYTRVRVRLQVV